MTLIHRTERGDFGRSKSELVIADKRFARGIDYVYEQPLELEGGRVRYPDSRSRTTHAASPSTGSTSGCSTIQGIKPDGSESERDTVKRASYRGKPAAARMAR